MRTRARAKLEEDIAALAKEVRELRRQRGVGLPEGEVLADFLVEAFGYDRFRELAEAIDSEGIGVFMEALRTLTVAPAAEPLRAAVLSVWETIEREDRMGFRQASGPLREALLPLLEMRAEKWRQPHWAVGLLVRLRHRSMARVLRFFSVS